MPSDAARQSSPPARIEIPEQLQQSQRPQTPRQGGSTPPLQEPERRDGAPRARREGILGQLETERAHD